MAVVARAGLGDRPLTQLLTDIGMVPTGKQVKDALARQAVHINGEVVAAEQNLQLPVIFARDKARFGGFYLVKLGKKNYHLIRID
jgi:tyrosyl-tRNA synthetase